MKIYLNGQMESSSYISNTLGSNYESIVIGDSPNSYPLNGAADDFRIYSRAISNTEVLQLYHEGGWQKKINP